MIEFVAKRFIHFNLSSSQLQQSPKCIFIHLFLVSSSHLCFIFSICDFMFSVAIIFWHFVFVVIPNPAMCMLAIIIIISIAFDFGRRRRRHHKQNEYRRQRRAHVKFSDSENHNEYRIVIIYSFF